MATTEERFRTLEDIVQGHEARINLLTGIAERQQDLLEEVRRDANQTQRLWVRLSRKYGWLDDEDLGE